ncbi:MAG: cupin domain-containing protein [Bryobacteraceae bacterium]
MITANEDFFFTPSLLDEVAIPAEGMKTQILRNDDHSKVILFAFAAGHELKAHSAPAPVSLHFLRGEGVLTVGEKSFPVTAGSFAAIAPSVTHAVQAESSLVMLLVIAKKPPP